MTFSLDLKEGQPLVAKDATGWNSTPLEIARQAVACGITRLIILDLADVGSSNGGATDGLCRTLLAEFPHLPITSGGGVRGPEDLRRLAQLGVKNVLVASALHDGRLTPSDVRRTLESA
jgi:phosphoribosylformimino-5-aminoimidazole carboxamide ribotide isomerase